MRRVLLGFVLSLTACVHTAPRAVVIAGAPVPRPRLGYTDHRYFVVNHVDAYPQPRGPSSGLRSDDGRIIGNVCGVQVNYEAKYHGRYLSVSGFVQNDHESDGGMIMALGLVAANHESLHGGGAVLQKSAYLEVRDRASAGGASRIITGYVGGAAGGGEAMMDRIGWQRPLHDVDLELSVDRLRGVVGHRRFDLAMRGSDLVGTFDQADHHVPFVLRDVGALWSMTATDQAVILPLMLTCDTETRIIQVVDLRTLGPIAIAPASERSSPSAAR